MWYKSALLLLLFVSSSEHLQKSVAETIGNDSNETTSKTPFCVDVSDNDDRCSKWASRGECSANPGYMLKNCRESCGSCLGGVPSSASTSSLLPRETTINGPADRFWRHHVNNRTLMIDGVNRYDDIQTCLDSRLTPQERWDMKVQTGERKVSKKVSKDEDLPYLLVLERAITPLHAKAVQALAGCIKDNYPKGFYECRPMYQEFNLEKDPGLGGNCPVHLAALIGIYLPEVVQEIERAVQVAFDAAGWMKLHEEHKVKPKYQGKIWKQMPLPKNIGIRASEHLTYSGFNKLASHKDGDATAFTINFALSGPEDYDGGEFYIKSKKSRRKTFIKPEKYDCMVFLGGRYDHGVNDILGGHREMFSNELWSFPDLPFGSTLWTAIPENMKEFVDECDEKQRDPETGEMDYNIPCESKFSTVNNHALDMSEVRSKYDNDNIGGSDAREEDSAVGQKSKNKKKTQTKTKRTNTAINGRERKQIVPDGLIPIQFMDGNGKVYDWNAFRPYEEEPDFLIPKKLDSGEMVPIRWRHTLEPLDGDEGESFVIGLPPQLLKEFQDYIEKGGMMDVAREMLYQETTPLKRGDQRVYTLKDGEKWSAMVQGKWTTDMVWLDPADEACYESLLAVLSRGGFDIVLEQMGKAFDLDGLMIQGVGAIYLSESNGKKNIHSDIPGSKRSFYNVIVPIHIPANDTATLNLREVESRERGAINLKPNVGIVLGGESHHGTGAVNYKAKEDFRLSFAIYVADINDDNIDLIASDSTSLWPSEGDTQWFQAQQGRLWSRDGTKSLVKDKGRKPMKVNDLDKKCDSYDMALCDDDPQGVRLRCPKKCKLYLEDEEYYKMMAGTKREADNVTTDPTQEE